MKHDEWHPGTLLETSGGYWKACALHAAVQLDVFTVMEDQRLSAEAVAERLKADPRALAMLLNALTAMNLLDKSGGLYANTPEAARFLSRKSTAYIGYIIKHHHHLVASWSQLDQAVQTGGPIRSRMWDKNDDARESFLMGMFNMAMNLAPRIVPKIDLSSRRSFLDLGGGPGTYAIQFCLKHSELQAVVFDLPTTRPFAEATIGKFGLSDRIRFQSGSYLEDPVEGSYDVAWLSHILHGEGPEDCQRIIQKAVAALSPGGMILIHEFILNNEMSGPLFPALFSLNMLLGTASGQAYSEQQLSDMLAGAGVGNIHRIAIDSPNDSGIIAGTI
ncbi:MAG: methyltransferase domain-containing protein [Deltaproteobacteria bacterium]|nr:methyltransferase domain-containing protein [Deltaproteobacteria bacterium]